MEILLCDLLFSQVLVFLFPLSVEQVIAGLDRAAATMRKGERAVLTIDPDYGFGSVEVRRELAVVPPCSKVIYEVEMLDCKRVMVNLMRLELYIDILIAVYVCIEFLEYAVLYFFFWTKCKYSLYVIDHQFNMFKALVPQHMFPNFLEITHYFSLTNRKKCHGN